MPVTMTSDLRDDFDKDPATLAQFFRLKLRDGTIVGITNYWKNVTDEEDGTVYKAENGLGPSAVESARSTAKGDNQDAQIFFDDDRITDEALEAGILDGAEFDHFIANYEDISRGKLYKNRGYIGDLGSQGIFIQGKFYGIEQILVTDIVDVTSPICRYEFGDSKCKVDVTGDDANGHAIQVEGVAVTGGPIGTGPENDTRRCFVASSLSTFPANNFNEGIIKFETGDNAPLGWFPVEWFGKNSSSEVQLTRRFPFPIQVGDTFTIRAGCDHQMRGNCKNRYDNVINFGGEPDIPQERVYEEDGAEDV